VIVPCVNINSNCKGFPTIRMYEDGKIIGDWQGDWSQKGVLESTAKEFLGEKGRKKSREKRRTQRKRQGKKRTQVKMRIQGKKRTQGKKRRNKNFNI